MTQPLFYFEDFPVGKRIEVGSVTVSEAEIIAFASRFDPQSFHVDQAAATDSVFGGIIASGWHTCSLLMRLMVDGYLRDSAALASPGVDEVRWLKPVRGGDCLTASSTVVQAVPSTSKPDRGVIYSRWEAVNQRGELVVTVSGRGLFLRRPD